MVKVTGFIGLGFAGMALARFLHQRVEMMSWLAILAAAGYFFIILLATIAAFTVISGICLGWITGQGGAATIRSWLSVSTEAGVASGFLGSVLGLGAYASAILSFPWAV